MYIPPRISLDAQHNGSEGSCCVSVRYNTRSCPRILLVQSYLCRVRSGV